MHFLSSQERIYVAGHQGMVGSAVIRQLRRNGYSNILYRTGEELDLRVETDVHDFFECKRPHYVILADSSECGTGAEDRNLERIIDEKLSIQSNVIDAAQSVGVKRLLFLSSSSIYPENAPEPLREESLLCGSRDLNTEGAAVVQIAGVMMCRAFRAEYGSDFLSLLATDLYGPGDRSDHDNGPVLRTILRDIVEARRAADKADLPVSISARGMSRRELLYVDDLADACLFVLRLPTSILDASVPDGLLNVGTGRDISILELAHSIRKTLGSKSELVFDSRNSDRTSCKLLDVSRLAHLGWTARTDLKEGLRCTLSSYLRTHRRGGRDAPSTRVAGYSDSWAYRAFAQK